MPFAPEDRRLPELLSKLEAEGLSCLPQSDFSFQDQGFIPIKVSPKIGPEEFRNKVYETGFEIYLAPFDYKKTLEELKKPTKQTWLNKLLVGKREQIAKDFIVDQETDKELSKQTQELHLVYRDDYLVPFAFAAVLSDLTNGLLFESEAGEYFKPKQALAEIPKLAKDWSPPVVDS